MNKYKYFVSFNLKSNYIMSGWGCTQVETKKPIEDFSDINDIINMIELQTNYKDVVILNIQRMPI